MRAKQRVIFGENANQTWHVFRRTDRLGLDRNVVMNAILDDLVPRLPLPFPPANNAPFVGNAALGPRQLRYHAYPVSEELVIVGPIRRLL